MRGLILGLGISVAVWLGMNMVFIPYMPFWAIVAMVVCAALGRSS